MNHFSYIYMFLGRVNNSFLLILWKKSDQIQIQDWINNLKPQSEFKIESIWYLIQIQIVARLQLLPAHWTKLCSRRSWNWLGFWGIWKLYKSETSWRTYHQEISWNEKIKLAVRYEHISKHLQEHPVIWQDKARHLFEWWIPRVYGLEVQFRTLADSKNSHQKGGAPEKTSLWNSGCLFFLVPIPGSFGKMPKYS